MSEGCCLDFASSWTAWFVCDEAAPAMADERTAQRTTPNGGPAEGAGEAQGYPPALDREPLLWEEFFAASSTLDTRRPAVTPDEPRESRERCPECGCTVPHDQQR